VQPEQDGRPPIGAARHQEKSCAVHRQVFGTPDRDGRSGPSCAGGGTSRNEDAKRNGRRHPRPASARQSRFPHGNPHLPPEPRASAFVFLRSYPSG
jgi:hypothetical protein